MQSKIELLSFTDKIALKVNRDYLEKTHAEYALILKGKLNLLLQLTNSLHEEKIEMPEWKTWCEPMIFKLAFHTSSFLQLFSGTVLDFKDSSFTVFDEPSVSIMFRAILENYLTFFYIFCDQIDDKEKSFRMDVYKYSGLKQRNSFRVTAQESKKKQETEKIEIERLHEVISNSVFFNAYDRNKQKEILKGTKPRLFYSWIRLSELSEFQTALFKDLYGYKSNYTHSEFISILQIKSKGFRLNKNEKEHFTLFLTHSLLCKCIIDLSKIFPSIKELFYKSDLALVKEIEIFNAIATNSTSEL